MAEKILVTIPPRHPHTNGLAPYKCPAIIAFLWMGLQTQYDLDITEVQLGKPLDREGCP